MEKRNLWWQEVCFWKWWLKKLNIKIRNAYDFYSCISVENKDKFEREKSEILEKIKIEKQQLLDNKKKEEIAKNILKIREATNEEDINKACSELVNNDDNEEYDDY